MKYDHDIVGLKHNGTVIGYMCYGSFFEKALLWLAVHDRKVKRIWHDGILWNVNIIGDPHRYLHRYRTLIHLWDEEDVKLVEDITGLIKEINLENMRECKK